MPDNLELKLIIRSDGSAAIRDLKKVNREVDELGRDSVAASRKTNQLASSLGKLAGAAGGLLIGQRAFSAFLESNVEAQKLQSTLETVTGSVDAAAKAWDQLEDFAASTPFQLQQSVNAFIRLKALGLDPSERALRSYANTASAMGKDLIQFVEAVADASVGEFERLKEFGIKASQQADQVTFTFRGASTTISKEAGAIQEYLLNIGETDFAGAALRQMDTLGGALSNLEDEAGRFWRALGDTGAADVVEGLIRAMTRELGGFTDEMEDTNSEWGDFLRGAERLIQIVDRYTGALQFLRNTGAAFQLGADTLFQTLGDLAGAWLSPITAIQELGRQGGQTLPEIQGRTEDWIKSIKQGAAELKRIDEELEKVRTADANEPQGAQGVLGRYGSQLVALRLEREKVMTQMRTYADLIQQEEGLYERAGRAASSYGQTTTGGADIELAGRRVNILSGHLHTLENAGRASQVALAGLTPEIQKWSEAFDVPEQLVVAVAGMESSFGRLQTSSAGAQGAMQFMDDTAKGVADRLTDLGYKGVTATKIQNDHTTAVMAGAFHLRELYDEFGNWTDALIAYNAGPGRAGDAISSLKDETKTYIAEIVPATAALIEQEEGHAAALKFLEAANRDNSDATRARTEAEREAGRIIESNLTPLERYTAELDRISDLQAQDLLNSEQATRAREAARIAFQKEIEALARANPIYQERIRNQEKLAQVAQTLIDRYIPAKSAAEDLATAEQALDLAVQAGNITRAQAVEILARYNEELRRNNLTPRDRRAEAFFNDLGYAIGSAAGELALFKDGEDVLRRLLERVQALIVELLIVEPIARAVKNALSGIFSGGGLGGSIIDFLIPSAKGNVFGSTGLPHGVYSHPTAFPLATPGVHGFAKGIGFLAEAGSPEAILPLKRSTDGYLGVRSEPSEVYIDINPAPGVQTQVRRDGNRISVFQQWKDELKAELTGDVVNGGNPFAEAFESTYGARRGVFR